MACLLGVVTGKREIASIYNKQVCKALLCLFSPAILSFLSPPFWTGQFPPSGSPWGLVKADENPVSREPDKTRARCDHGRNDGGKEKAVEGMGDNQRFPLLRGKL